MESKKVYRCFLFTWNNYDESSIEYLRSEIVPKSKYVIWGKEIAPNTGTPHLQGFVQFPNQKSVGACIKLFPGNHITPVTVDNGCAKYSTKDGDYEEHGVRPMTPKEKGAREIERWERTRNLAKAGTIEEVDADIYLRMYRTLKEIAKDHMPDVDSIPELENEWIYGVSGSGKTRGVLERYPEAYLKTCNKWWDGYQGEETVLIDDIDETHKCLVHHLKIWGDHKPFLAETKGGMKKIRPKRIICTSNVPLSEMAEHPHLEALKRRYKEVEMNGNEIEPPKKRLRLTLTHRPGVYEGEYV